jgi:histidyl-tRNA synthetase
MKKHPSIAVKGMADILPDVSHHWLWLEDIVRNWFAQYGYRNIRTPILEYTALFDNIGTDTDIVTKEMYSFIDNLNGDELTLRPEGTAAVVRCVIGNHLIRQQSQKLWYMGPMFRHERPQRGRQRQFHQIGAEALGFHGSGANLESEMLVMLAALWQQLGLDLQLHINCLGNTVERSHYKEALSAYLYNCQDALSADLIINITTNPLRILDSKDCPAAVLSAAPKILDFLQAESAAHHQQLCNNLTRLGITYIENPLLVRGLDYYNLSVFEWIEPHSSNNFALCGGGRYNALYEKISGSNTDHVDAVGFAIGIERVLLLLAERQLLPPAVGSDIYIANAGNGTAIMALQLARTLRHYEFTVDQYFGTAGFKQQFKLAATQGCKFVIVIGEHEVQHQLVTIKNLTNSKQDTIAINAIIAYFQAHKDDSRRHI